MSARGRGRCPQPERKGSWHLESFGILANLGRDVAVTCTQALVARLHALGKTVRLDRELAQAAGFPELATHEVELGRTDLLIALGGDGTLLAANRAAAPRGTPILGIHAGGPASFGFLTETTPNCAIEALDRVLAGTAPIEVRLMVAAEIYRQGRLAGRFDALNELVIRAQSRMLKMGVTVGSTFIATYAADGIIVATPTGSTAYNLAAGGPLVHPALDALILTPICPHTLNVRSLLVYVDHTIRVTLESGERDVTLLTVDGQISFTLERDDEIRFLRSPLKARFVALDPSNFYNKVQTRLRLGERFGG